MADAPTFTGMVIGQAEAATRALLDDFLTANGGSFIPWAMLTLLARAGGTLARGELVSQVSRARRLDAASAMAAVEELIAGGHARLRSEAAWLVEMTPSGMAFYQRLKAGVDGISARLYGDLPVDDLAAAARVLTIVTQRAKAELK